MITKRLFQTTITLIVLTFLLSYHVYGQQGSPEGIGRIVKVKGDVQVFDSKKKLWVSAQQGMVLHIYDKIKTGKDGKASIIFEDETIMQLNKNTHILVEAVAKRAGWTKIRRISLVDKVQQSIYSVTEGEIWFRNKNRDANVTINAPNLSAGIRGTDLTVKVLEDMATIISVLEGTITAYNDFGKAQVSSGEEVIGRKGTAPQKRMLLQPIDAVQWTIVIPPVLEQTIMKEQELIDAYRLILDGELRTACNLLHEFVLKRPDVPQAWGMLALNALLLNEKDRALMAINRGVKLSPDTPYLLLIKSYIHQAFFDLKGAINEIHKALEIEPNNILILTQYARLKFATEYIDEAWRIMEKAEGIEPENCEVLNLKGFLLLARLKTEEAIKTFKKATGIDHNSGEPHMGLALAYMRQGDVASAMEEITTASLLEPQRAMFLNYWAKMLYQIGRHNQAIDILNFAAKLDPNDPTPELYRAIILRDLNRPTEAIHALNKAISLNDNRAVYRSRFLLDKDLAVKNVDLSILYNRLGLTDWAKSKALSSIKEDYTNSSGHLFLAGALREEVDRSWEYSGEMLLARMFMPANQNSFNTFNEYTMFFEEPALKGTVTGKTGTNNFYEGDATFYGGIPAANLAFGAGMLYSETDGWKGTNDERQASGAAILKWDMTFKDSILFAASSFKAKQGDKIYPRYSYNTPKDPESYQKERVSRIELGYRHIFSPSSTLLFHISRLENNGTLYDNRVRDGILNLNIDKGYKMPYTQIQLHYMHRTEKHHLFLGTSHYSGNYRTEYVPIINNNMLGFLNRKTGVNQRMESYYFKDTWKINDMFIFEGALYYDRIKDRDGNMDTLWDQTKLLLNISPYETKIKKGEFGPRVGLIFSPVKNHTIRLASFRYLLPFITSRLDPTDIAGIAIYRNGPWGSTVKETDLAWEYEWSTGFISNNLFYLKKTYDFKVISPNREENVHMNGRIKGFEMKLNQLLWNGMGLNAGYRYRYIEDDALPQSDREEHQLSGGLNFLHRTGLFAGVKQVYRRQNTLSSGLSNENIWLTDAHIGYEFPNKKGTLKLEGKNIFNHHFNWITDYYTLTGRVPKREIFCSLQINF